MKEIEVKDLWVKCCIEQPNRAGRYRCLIERDEFGTLEVIDDCVFNGIDWDSYDSGAQFTVYWSASYEEYAQIADKYKTEMEDYFKGLIGGTEIE